MVVVAGYAFSNKLRKHHDNLKTIQEEYFVKVIFSSNDFSCYYFVAGGYTSINEIKSDIHDLKANADKRKDDMLAIKGDMLAIRGQINTVQSELVDIKMFLKYNNQQK